MKLQILFLLIFFIPLNSFGQSNLIDTGITKKDCYVLWLSKPNIPKMLNHSRSNIKKVLGGYVHSKYVILDTTKSTKCDFQIWARTKLDTKQFNMERLNTYPYFTLHYYLIKDLDTLNYFNFIVDSLGNPVKHANTFFTFSSPMELLKGFKKLFYNYFKINHTSAINIGRKYKFIKRPTFDYDINNKKF